MHRSLFCHQTLEEVRQGQGFFDVQFKSNQERAMAQEPRSRAELIKAATNSRPCYYFLYPFYFSFLVKAIANKLSHKLPTARVSSASGAAGDGLKKVSRCDLQRDLEHRRPILVSPYHPDVAVKETEIQELNKQ